MARTYTEDQIRAAKDYIAAQIAIMGTYGDAPVLSNERYERLLRDVLRVLPQLKTQNGKPGRIKGQRCERGICPACGRDYAVTKRGRIWPHSVQGVYHGGMQPKRDEASPSPK